MTRKINRIFILVVTFLLCAVAVIFGQGNLSVYAAADTEKVYSDVLDDLKKDSSFSASYYPSVANDYSVQIIQLGESADNELFVYVYQPAARTKTLLATSINISTTINDSISFQNYKLEKLNSNGTLFKYLVKGFTVSNQPTRYYAISSIYRKYDATIDKQAGNGNTITEVNYNVSKQYCFSEINGKPYCQVVDIETIEITDKFVGFVRYNEYESWFYSTFGSCDSHFVAFSTNKPIDRLLEADVCYTSQSYEKGMGRIYGNYETFGEKKVDPPNYVTLTGKPISVGGNGLFGTKYHWEWYEIETVEQFISEVDTTKVFSGAIIDATVASKLTDEGKAAIQNKQWVLRFANTPFTVQTNGSMPNGTFSTLTKSTIVGDVTILRLKFETDGITYNLGVIDNKQTGSNKPVNETEVSYNLSDTGKAILGIIILIIVFILLLRFAPGVLMIIGKIIIFPFKLIGRLFKKIGESSKKRREERQAQMEANQDPVSDTGQVDKKQKRKRKQKQRKEEITPPDLSKNVSQAEVDQYLDSIDWDSIDWSKLDGS